MKEIKSSQLRGSHRCNVSRKFENIAMTSKKGIRYDEAIIAIDIIKGFFKGEWNIHEINDLVNEGYGLVDDSVNDTSLDAGEEIVISKQLEAKANELATNIRRYLNCETRTPVSVPYGSVIIGDYEIKCTPTLAFDDGKTLELVLIRTGKPDVTQSGRKQDASVNTSLELYAMCRYGRSLVKAGETRQIIASYYFLRKNTDSSLNAWDNDFFSGSGGNVVSLVDDAYLGGSNMRSSLDIDFEPQFEEFIKGTECNLEACDKCKYKIACNYQKAPKPLETKTLSNKKGKITPSEKQKQIIDFRNGICRVNATAGSGKTECMTERAVQMFEEGISPKEVLLITFTDAGALELKERIKKKCDERHLFISKDDIKAMTFNAFAMEVVVDNYETIGFSETPHIANKDITRYNVVIAKLLKQNIITGMESSYKNFDMDMPACKGMLALVNKAFELIKAENINIDNCDASANLKYALQEIGWYRFYNDTAIDELIDLYKEYSDNLINNNLLTFSDQEPMMYKILDVKPEYLETYGFKHIVVDEFQDTNTVQMETIKRLTDCKCFESLMVVGDDSQSIYSFRHTSQENILNFFNKIGKVGCDLYLTDNRRSTPEICTFANAINDLCTTKVEKEMNSTREHGHKVEIKGCHNKEAEYKMIANNIKSILDKGDYIAEDIAFIAMSNAELVKMASELSALEIPWVMRNPMKLMDNSRVISAISLADAFYDPDADNVYFNYLVSKEDGDILNKTSDEIRLSIDALKTEFKMMITLDIEVQKKWFHEMLEEIKGDDEVYSHFLDLVYDNKDFTSELVYIQNFKRFGKNESYKMQNDYAGVVLTTAHSSKGLEWPVCFVSVSGFDSKRLHTGRPKIAEIDEKRRLLFVACTRARDILVISGQYIAYGGKKDATYNQFLRECFECMGCNYDPIDHISDIKDKVEKAGKQSKSNTRDLTPEEIKEYEKLIKNSEQMSIEAFL